LAFRNDSYTLESRINQAERERNLTEENTEKELENFKTSITVIMGPDFRNCCRRDCH
jgi:inositol 1,4,5-triphosphate receptor-associated cGMP kinase